MKNLQSRQKIHLLTPRRRGQHLHQLTTLLLNLIFCQQRLLAILFLLRILVLGSHHNIERYSKSQRNFYMVYTH